MNLPEPIITEAIPTFHFPKHSVEYLAHGIKCFFVPDFNQELLHISIKAKYGAANEKFPGVAALTAALMLCGTPKHSTLEIADIVDSYGASLRVSKQWDSTGVNISGLSEFGNEMIELLADCVCNPVFSESEFSRNRNEAISELQFELSDPRFTASRAFVEGVFQNHPYAHSRIGTLQSLSELTVDDCISFYNDMRTNGEWYIVVAGNFQHEQIRNALEQRFSSLQTTSKIRSRIIQTDLQVNKAMYVHMPESLQSTVLVGNLTIDIFHEDYPALHILTTILGGYFLARLNVVLREQKGYTYGAFAGVDNRFHSTDLSVHTSVGNEHTLETYKIIQQEIQRIATEPISDNELQRCIRFMLGSFARSTETPQHIVGFIHGMEVLDADVAYYERFIHYLATITPEKLFPAQQRLFTPNAMVYAASGDRDVLKQALSHFAEPLEITVS